uniref:Uncharacterized protein n=2 Tax=Canis lupus familiaris TaxID=9615 RepID=A0A8I3PRH4_CANLF
MLHRGQAGRPLVLGDHGQAVLGPLLPVQRGVGQDQIVVLVSLLKLKVLPHHDELRVLGPIRPGPHLDGEEVVGGERVGVQGVVAHVRVRGAVQRDARPHGRALRDLDGDDGPRELRGVVVDVQHLHLDVEQLQVLGGERDHVELDAAVEVPRAQLLAVDGRAHADLARVLVHPQQRRAAPLHGPEAHGRAGQPPQRLGRVLRQPRDHRAHPLLLVDAVPEVAAQDGRGPGAAGSRAGGSG